MHHPTTFQSPHPNEHAFYPPHRSSTLCLSCEGTGIHMQHGKRGREIVCPRPGTCPTCSGSGLMPQASPAAIDRKQTAAEGR